MEKYKENPSPIQLYVSERQTDNENYLGHHISPPFSYTHSFFVMDKGPKFLVGSQISLPRAAAAGWLTITDWLRVPRRDCNRRLVCVDARVEMMRWCR